MSTISENTKSSEQGIVSAAISEIRNVAEEYDQDRRDEDKAIQYDVRTVSVVR